MAKVKKKSVVSPIGEAKWAHVHEPKAPYEGTGEGKYQIDVVFDKGSEWDELGREVAQIVKSNGYANMPIKNEKTRAGDPTGRFFITFKTGAQYPPQIFDKAGQKIPPDIKIGNGSKVRVCYTKDTYKGFGGGVTFYFNALQVVDLVEYHGGSATDYGFPIEESDNPFLDSGLEDPPKEDDDIPF